MPYKQRAHIQLKTPFGRALLLGAVFLAGIAILIELIARTPIVQSRIPFQAYGTSHIQFEMQLERLDAFLKEHGEPDCLFMGNSMSLRGINPEIFSQTYKEITGEDILCYNFSVLGADASATYKFIELLSDKFDIKTVILGTNFIDFTSGRDEVVDERFHYNKWIDYHIGKPTFQGWLAENSFAYRLLLLLGYTTYNRLQFDLVNHDVEKWDYELTPYGYGYTEKIREDIQNEMDRSLRTNLIEQYGDFSLSERGMTNLENIAELHQELGVRVIIVEMPFHPSLLELYDNEGRVHPNIDKAHALIDQAYEFFQAVSANYEVPFWKPEQLEIPSEGWLDRYHLNYDGSQVFSKWLAESYANAFLSGEFTDSTAGQ